MNNEKLISVKCPQCESDLGEVTKEELKDIKKKFGMFCEVCNERVRITARE